MGQPWSAAAFRVGVSKAAPDGGRGVGVPHAAVGYGIHLLSAACLSPFKGLHCTFSVQSFIIKKKIKQ